MGTYSRWVPLVLGLHIIIQMISDDKSKSGLFQKERTFTLMETRTLSLALLGD